MKIIQIMVVLLVFLVVPQLTWGQSSSSNKPGKEDRIVCKFGYTQFVNFNVIGKGKKEVVDLRHTDILIYENNLLQELHTFEVIQDADIKKIGYRYRVGYDPLNQIENGKYRAIRIVAKTKGRQRYKVRASLDGYYARKGYYKY